MISTHLEAGLCNGVSYFGIICFTGPHVAGTGACFLSFIYFINSWRRFVLCMCHDAHGLGPGGSRALGILNDTGKLPSTAVGLVLTFSSHE